MWGDVGAASQDTYKPWNPYEFDYTLSANDLRMAENLARIRGNGWSGWYTSAAKTGDTVGYFATNLLAGQQASKAVKSYFSLAGMSGSTAVGTCAAPVGYTSLFGRGGTGLLNSNSILRLGWGWRGSSTQGQNVFRLAWGSKGSWFHGHFDLWPLW
jgi:hypothetical protein